MKGNWTDIENEILEEISNFDFDFNNFLDSFTKEIEEEICNKIMENEYE